MKFVIYGPDYEATSRLLDDIKDTTDVFYYDNPLKIENKFLRKVAVTNMSRFTWFPLLWLWKYFVAYGDIKKNEDVIFVYWTTWFLRLSKCGFIKYIKRKYPKTQHIVRYTDVHAARKYYTEELREYIDEAYIFDKVEAEKLNMKYYRLNCSKHNIDIKENIPYSDLFFVGQAKDRYDELIKVFEWCKRHDVSTNFHIIGVPKEKQLYVGEINYPETFIPYEETLQICMQSKCVLELQLADVTSYSNRVYEALIYGKRVLSNNQYLKNEEFFSDDYMCVFEDVENIDPDFVKGEPINGERDFAYEFSPKRFLEFLEENYNATKAN